MTGNLYYRPVGREVDVVIILPWGTTLEKPALGPAGVSADSGKPSDAKNTLVLSIRTRTREQQRAAISHISVGLRRGIEDQVVDLIT